ncbi:hypothetical protein QOL99_02145 [Deinococcus sp. MIMF12]|uniref:Uncharacterized protein n=1 Tax=Deinococcus rhizophilus TaxID=3049544 RepID=A0ABT7JD16_9DEIO|nr:hypothetical protein [Deinococcus rhizophilus]MDL2342944.1 hypothetical protein [Deinococcus rhizophilus]
MSGKLNLYTFELYVQTYGGQLALDYFKDLSDFAERADLLEPFLGVGNWIVAHLETEEGEEVAWENVTLHADDVKYIGAVRDAARGLPCGTAEEARQLLLSLVNSGTVRLSEEPGDVLELDHAFADLPLLSLGLYLAHPDVFVPYGFVGRYYLLSRIAEEFGIALPPVPPKQNRLERWLYYGQVCAALQEFRQTYDLTPPGLLAFLYDFAPNYVTDDLNDDLPHPRQAWLLIGGVDNGDLDWMEEQAAVEQANWQGNLDMRRGDVCIMYVRSPVSATHSLWRVVVDAYEDPFFHYKHTVQIGQPLRLPALHFRDIAADSVLGQNRYVKANLQGASGKALSRAEYHRFLDLMAARGPLPEGVPSFPEAEAINLAALASERDVEVKLVEPLLHRAGLEAQDWLRQLPVRMGRGERVYPDYAIGLTGKAPEQRVRALVEVKYRVGGERAWRDAFLQAKSYGLRLGASVILTAAAEGVRVYERRNDDFDFAQGTELTWAELQEGERLRWLSRLLSG